jgi:nucleoside-diphosphate-sugar epimerase
MPEHVPEFTVVGDIGPNTSWDEALAGVDAVVHLAARAHILNDAPENEDLYVQANTYGTERLAAAAAQVRVRRFVFLSSVKVNGENSRDRPYTAGDEPHPEDAYGASKCRAESSVTAIAAQTGLQAEIVRSPLVYGPGVRANFLRLLRWVDAGWPLPLGAICNRRSLVSVWNLCDLLVNLLDNRAAGATWMVSDGEDLSTPELIRQIARSMGRPARLVPVPVGVLRAAGGLIGKQAEIARLCGSLAVDIAPTRARLGWAPPVSISDALSRTTSWYLSEWRLQKGRPNAP